jgi:hypothetical protein
MLLRVSLSLGSLAWRNAMFATAFFFTGSSSLYSFVVSPQAVPSIVPLFSSHLLRSLKQTAQQCDRNPN